jgi:type IV pilus assembly protein PilN
MLEVNLLPHREAKRIADLRESVIVLLLGSLLVMMIALMMDSRVSGQLERAEIRISQLESNILEFKPQQDQVAEFRAQKSDLEEKLGVIRKLDLARKGPVRVFDELAARTPDRLWLTQIVALDGRLFLEGNSLDNDVIADFLKSLGASEYLGNVDLIRTDGDTAVKGVRLVEFEISTDLVIPDPEIENGSTMKSAGA